MTAEQRLAAFFADPGDPGDLDQLRARIERLARDCYDDGQKATRDTGADYLAGLRGGYELAMGHVLARIEEDKQEHFRLAADARKEAREETARGRECQSLRSVVVGMLMEHRDGNGTLGKP